MTELTARVGTPDLDRRTSLLQDHLVRAFIVFLVAVLTRIPFRASYLVNWDSVNFALGVEDFNLASHQPHPPGYIGYVLLGRLIRWFVGDPVVALTGISILAGAAATMSIYLLGTRISGERTGLIAAALFGTSPLVWYYSEVALTYIVEAALVLPIVILIMGARDKRSVPHLIAATVLLATMGAIRQTSLLLFLPVWLFGLLAFPRRARWLSGLILVGAVTAWLIPLLVWSGGPLEYLRLSSQLAQLTGSTTWLGAGSAVLRNFVLVGAAIILGLHAALLALPMWAMARREPDRLSADHRRLFLVWGLPPLLTYLLIHSGQLGYVLNILPIGIVWASHVLARRMERVNLRPLAGATVLVTVNIVGFFVLPEIAYAAVSRGSMQIPEQVANRSLLKRGIQQVSLRRNDAYWESMINWVEDHEPESVAILTEPRDGGSFRQLSFYLPDYTVYGIGADRNGDVGYLFSAADRVIDYSVDNLEEASSLLALPDRIRILLIPDPGLQARMGRTFDLSYEILENGTLVAEAEVPPQSAVVFVGSTGEALLLSSDTSFAMLDRDVSLQGPFQGCEMERQAAITASGERNHRLEPAQMTRC